MTDTRKETRDAMTNIEMATSAAYYLIPSKEIELTMWKPPKEQSPG